MRDQFLVTNFGKVTLKKKQSGGYRVKVAYRANNKGTWVQRSAQDYTEYDTAYVAALLLYIEALELTLQRTRRLLNDRK